MKYEDSFLGDIVIIRNIIFKNDHSNKLELDHAFYNGRPCIIIYSDNEYDYFLTLTKGNKKIKDYCYNYFLLNKEDTLYKNGPIESSYVVINHIYKVPVSFRKRKNKIKYEVYLELLKEVKRRYNTNEIDTLVKKHSLLKK